MGRRQITVLGLRIVLELRGISCFGPDQTPQPKKPIVRSRPCGRDVIDMEEILEPLACYVSAATRVLRMQGSVAGAVRVSIATSRFDEYSYGNSTFRTLPWPMAHTGELIEWACRYIRRIYRPSFAYLRCGIMLTAADTLQKSLPTQERCNMKESSAPLGARGAGAAVACVPGTSVAALCAALGRSAGFMHVTGM